MLCALESASLLLRAGWNGLQQLFCWRWLVVFGVRRYILEGKELEFYARKMQKKKHKAAGAS